MGRWLIMLVASLFGAIPFFRRYRERRGRKGGADGAAGPRVPWIPPAQAEKLAPIWAGFGDEVAHLAGGPATAPADPGAGAPVAAAAVATAAGHGGTGAAHAGIWIPIKHALPWCLGVVVALGLVAPPGSTARAYVVLTGVSGLVGWATTWIALWLLFRPTKPRYGFGVIPANRGALIQRIAEAIERHLVNPELIAAWLAERGIVRDFIAAWHAAASRVLKSTEFREGLRRRLAATGRLWLDDGEFRAAIGTRVAEAARGVIRSKLWKVVADLVEKPLLDRLRTELEAGLARDGGTIIDSALPAVDAWLDTLAASLEGSVADVEAVVSEQIVAGLRRLDIHGLVTSRLTLFEDGRLEELLRLAVLNELAAVEVIGGVLGCICGVLVPLLL